MVAQHDLKRHFGRMLAEPLKVCLLSLFRHVEGVTGIQIDHFTRWSMIVSIFTQELLVTGRIILVDANDTCRQGHTQGVLFRVSNLRRTSTGSLNGAPGS